MTNQQINKDGSENKDNDTNNNNADDDDDERTEDIDKELEKDEHNKQNEDEQDEDKSDIIEDKQNEMEHIKSVNNDDDDDNNNNNDYLQLKKQYEGMVKLWNDERSNLKKAQQLLRNQKDNFKLQQQSLEDDHLSKIDQLKSEYEQQLKSKSKLIESLESSLLKVKEERNVKIEDGDELKQKINELESEKYEILKEKSSLSLEKQEQIESIRKEFELERIQWEKERKILTKNFEHETVLEKEKVEFTNALARTQSILQQKELENARLKGELTWLKQDKQDLTKTNQILKEQNVSSQQQIDSLQQIISDKTKEIVDIKNISKDKLNQEIQKLNQLKIENEKMKQLLNKTENNSMNNNQSQQQQQQQKIEKRIKNLTNTLLEKQTELDLCISQKNEYRIKLSKLQESNNNNKKDRDLEMGSIKNRTPILRNKSGLTLLRRKNYTSYKSINYGINVFDRIGLEFAHVLRNKPWMRLLIVFYIIVLHLWCGIVLHFSMNHVEDDSH